MKKNKILISGAGVLLLCGSNANAGNFVDNSGDCSRHDRINERHIAVPVPGGGFICQDDYVNNETGENFFDGIVDVNQENRDFAALHGGADFQ